MLAVRFTDKKPWHKSFFSDDKASQGQKLAYRVAERIPCVPWLKKGGL